MKRFKKVLKVVAIATAASTVLLLLANAYFVWTTGSQLETRLAAIRQAGLPVRLADFAHKPIPPESNADVYLRRAADDLAAIEKELAAAYPKTAYPTADLAPPEQANLEKIFNAYPKVFPLLEQAASCPDSDPQIDASVPPSQFLQPYMDHTTRHRVILRVARARSAYLLSKNRPDDALATQLLVLRLTRHWRREPLLIGDLVTAVCEQSAIEEANRILRTSTIAPASRQALDAELALHDTLEGYTWALQSERAYSLSAFQEISGSGFWLTRGFSNSLALSLLDLFDRHLAAASLPHASALASWNSPPSSSRPWNPYNPLVTLLHVGLIAARDPADRVRALSRSLRVFNALQLHPPADANAPPQLSTLQLPPETTLDPFNGQPLRLKKTPSSWLIYSVGPNALDDGGNLTQRTDVGLGPLSLDLVLPKQP